MHFGRKPNQPHLNDFAFFCSSMGASSSEEFPTVLGIVSSISCNEASFEVRTSSSEFVNTAVVLDVVLGLFVLVVIGDAVSFNSRVEAGADILDLLIVPSLTINKSSSFLHFKINTVSVTLFELFCLSLNKYYVSSFQINLLRNFLPKLFQNQHTPWEHTQSTIAMRNVRQINSISITID